VGERRENNSAKVGKGAGISEKVRQPVEFNSTINSCKTRWKHKEQNNEGEPRSVESGMDRTALFILIAKRRQIKTMSASA